MIKNVNFIIMTCITLFSFVGFHHVVYAENETNEINKSNIQIIDAFSIDQANHYVFDVNSSAKILSYDVDNSDLYTIANLNLRYFPNINTEPITVIPSGTKIHRIGITKVGWSLIEYKDLLNNDGKNIFFVWDEYLSDEPSEKNNDNQVQEKIPIQENTNLYLGNFKLTAYCNCNSCCGEYANGLTASGTIPTQGRTIAMNDIAFGTQLMINNTVYTVEDRGTPYGHIDVYFNDHSSAENFGLQYADVYIVN